LIIRGRINPKKHKELFQTIASLSLSITTGNGCRNIEDEFMVLVITQMNVHPEKHRELSQTMASLIISTRMEKGCRRCDFCQSVEDENNLFLLEEWDTEEKLMTHRKSEYFKVLRGAMNLLREPYERMVLTVFQPAGMAEI
jgi:quinol monooxygenase YgiN